MRMLQMMWIWFKNSLIQTVTCQYLRYLKYSLAFSTTLSGPGCGSSRITLVALMPFLPATS